MKATFRIAHKYLSLAVGALWMLQALSGAFMVFHRSIDDWALGASPHGVDLSRIDTSLEKIGAGPPGAKVIEVFPSGGADGQVDVLVDRTDGRREVVRLDGQTGEVLRVSAWEHPAARVAPSRLVLMFHKQLLAGTLGHWLIGLSGALLFSNLILGLRMAWPARGRWRATLLPPRAKSPAMRILGWHRAAGLWLAPFGLIMAGTGALLVWSPELERAVGAAGPSPGHHELAPPGDRPVRLSVAVRAAMRVYGDATLADVVMPSADHPYFTVKLRRPGEWRRVYGTTLVHVDQATGRVLDRRDALSAPARVRIVEGLYPLHSGEWGGLGARIFVMLLGFWLATTAGLGLFLWWTRRRMSAAAARRSAS